MLSQTSGTLGAPADLGNYTDAKHYKMPSPYGDKTVYGMMTLSPSSTEHHLLAFTSCRRFAGQFYINGQSLKVVVDTEDRELQPGETWKLESFTYASGTNREDLLALSRSTDQKPSAAAFS
jgi:alpha-galactosidase